jgi:hypothetical protein
MSSEITKLSDNLYPKGDYETILEKLSCAGFEPFGNVKGRKMSSKDITHLDNKSLRPSNRRAS